MRGNLERAAHIAAPGLRRWHCALAGRRTGAPESRRHDGFARQFSERPCQFGCLVVTPVPKPRWVQRNGHDDICFLQQVASGAVEPARKAGYEVQPVGMLESQNRTAAVFVVAHHSSGPIEGRRVGKTGGAVRVAARIEFERQTAAETGRSVEKLDILPARGAKAARLRHLSTATDTQRRIEKIERAAPGTPQTAFQSAAHRG